MKDVSFLRNQQAWQLQKRSRNFCSFHFSVADKTRKCSTPFSLIYVSSLIHYFNFSWKWVIVQPFHLKTFTRPLCEEAVFSLKIFSSSVKEATIRIQVVLLLMRLSFNCFIDKVPGKLETMTSKQKLDFLVASSHSNRDESAQHYKRDENKCQQPGFTNVTAIKGKGLHEGTREQKMLSAVIFNLYLFCLMIYPYLDLFLQ